MSAIESKRENKGEEGKDVSECRDAYYDSDSDNNFQCDEVGITDSEDLHPLDEFNDQQVVDMIHEMERACKHLHLENILFTKFLQEEEPSALEDVEVDLEFLRMQNTDGTVQKSKLRLESYLSLKSIVDGNGPKINLTQKTEMTVKAIEEIQTKLQAFLTKSHRIQRNLKCELEEYSIRESEIQQAMEIFETSVVTQGLDPLTQRIPAEKFVRYMEEWLKSAHIQREKLRLRLATYKLLYKKAVQQHTQRKQLGENVHAVDFDQLAIENKNFAEKIEEKNKYLMDMKTVNGGTNLILTNHKQYLQKQLGDCNRLTGAIKEKRQLLEKTEAEFRKTNEELRAATDKLMFYKSLKAGYTVPEVTEYMQLKGQLYELKKNIKVWQRRNNIQEIALKASMRQLEHLRGQDVSEDDTDSDTYETMSY